MAKHGLWFKFGEESMLEARKLSAQVKQDQAGKLWSWLSVLVFLATMAVVASV